MVSHWPCVTDNICVQLQKKIMKETQFVNLVKPLDAIKPCNAGTSEPPGSKRAALKYSSVLNGGLFRNVLHVLCAVNTSPILWVSCISSMRSCWGNGPHNSTSCFLQRKNLNFESGVYRHSCVKLTENWVVSAISLRCDGSLRVHIYERPICIGLP